MPLFGPPNIEKMKARHDVKGLVKALGYQKDWKVRKAAAEALGELRDPRVLEPFIALLQGGDFELQQSAAMALGKLKDPRAVGPLILALEDVMVRKEAINALSEFGAPAVEQLRRMGNALPLSAMTSNKTEIELLGRIGNDRAVELLIDGFDKNKDGDCRKEIIDMLGKIGSMQAKQYLVGLLGEREREYYRPLVVAALDKAGWQPAQDEIGAFYWIEKRAWEKCVEIGAPAVEPIAQFIVGPYGDTKRDPEAFWALGEIGKPAVKQLLNFLHNEHVRNLAVEALDKIGWQPGQDEIGALYWIEKGAWEKCVEIGVPAVEPLIRGLDHDEAADALVKIGSLAVEPIFTALKANHKVIEPRIASVLAEIGDARAVEPLIAAYKEDCTALWPWMVEARRAIAQALIKLYQSKKLESKYMALILAQRESITAPHHDYEACGHGDSGPVIDFPL